MTQENIVNAMSKYANQIPRNNLSDFHDYLVEAPDSCADGLMAMPKMKNKIVTLMFSIFLGGIAVDRFYLGNTVAAIIKILVRIIPMIFTNLLPMLGILKIGSFMGFLITLPGLIWYIADIFLTYKAAQEMNYARVSTYLERAIAVEKEAQ